MAIPLTVALGLRFGAAQTAAPSSPVNSQTLAGTAGVANARAVVNFSEIATRDALQNAETLKQHFLARPLMGITGAVASAGSVVAELSSLVAAPSVQSPSPTDSFVALGDNNTTIPPDTMGAAGTNQLMVTLNSQVRIQTKAGVALSTVSHDSFWSSLSNPSAFDPKVMYDPFNHRWIFGACADAQSASSSVLMGVSQTADATGAWNLYRVDVDPNGVIWADYPSVGFNKDWIVMQVNMFRVSNNTFSNSYIYVFNKADLYAHGVGQFTLIKDNTGGFAEAPAVTYDNSLAAMFLVEDWIGSLGQLRISKITGAVGAETLTTGIAFPSTASTWSDSPTGNGDVGPQLGSSQLINNGDSRIINCVYRNGSLWAAQGIFLPVGSPTRSSAQWWQMTTNGVVQQRGRIDDATGLTFYAFPSIAVNTNSDVLIGYSRFATNQYASANYSFRLASDPANTLQADVVLKAGEGAYYKTFSGTENRWGDFSSTVVDPVNDTDFWTIQEYAATPVGNPNTNGSGRWGTWWGHITTTPPIPDLIVQTITNAPIYPAPGSSVNFTMTVKNQGTGAAGAFNVGFFSNSGSAPVISTAADQVKAVPSLAAGVSTQLVFTITAPASGTYTAWGFADVGTNLVSESDETNNAGPQPSGLSWIANSPPTVSAGTDQTITLPTNSVTLTGTASDDGLPSALTTTWSKFSGPGTVTFGNANALSTTATFSLGGSYVLRLTANDGAVSTNDSMTVIVNTAPTINAGTNQVITLPTSSVTLNGFASDDGLPSGTLTTTWTKFSGPGTVTFGNASVTNTTASFSLGGTYVLRLTASDTVASVSSNVTMIVNTAPTVSAGTNQTVNLPASVQLSGTASDDGLPSGTLTTTWTKFSGLGVVTFGNASVTNTTASFSVGGTYVLRLTANDGAASSTSDVTITANGAPTVNAGPDQTVTLPTNSVTLAGVVTDDGFPSGTLTTTWTKFSGPGTVTFGNVSVTNTTASFSTSGSYTLRLTASDGAATTTNDVIIIVNIAPTVNPGSDQTITLPTNAVTLAGFASDDGLPSGTLTTTWSKFSGPGTVTFGNASVTNTTASFSAGGTYVLRLSATDGAATTFSNMTVIVNARPTATAGVDQTVTLPTNSVTLAGFASDDGLPSGTLTTTWSKLSGPGTVTFGNASVTNTMATFSAGGSYTLRLTASDGLASTNDDVIIIINTAPTVNAGIDQTITLPTNSVTLAGVANDDGLPGALATTWTKFSGPGIVTFGNASVTNTTASFSVGGTYTLRLTANDGAASANDDVIVIVNAAPTVNAGPDQTVTLPTNSVTLAGVAGDDSLPSGTLTTIWSKLSGPGTVTFGNASVTNTTASFSTGGTYTLRLTVSDGVATVTDDMIVIVNAAPTVNAGQDQTVTLPTSANLSGSASDDGLPAGSLTTTWSKVSGPGIVTFGNAGVTNTTASFSVGGTYTLRLTANDGAAAVTDDVVIIANVAPTANAGPDQTITLPTNSATLAGVASDDGLPSGTLTTTWSKLSGPGTVTFGDATMLSTSAGFSSGGTYVLRLTVSDGVAMTTDDVMVIVNAKPTVNAGSDQVIAFPSSANLVGTASDDGLPSGTLTTTWTKLSGPGVVTLGNANITNTTASFSVSGTYTLRLTANDGVATTTDDIVIIANVAPTANAGTDRTITLPTNSVTLAGVASDDGLPSGTLTTTWSKLSGPGTVTFGNASVTNTTATFSAGGTYVLRLTVNDSAATTTDDMTVIVNAPPSVNAGPDQAVAFPTAAILSGSASDDGLPTGVFTTTWSKLSGPGTVTFGNASVTNTTASFSTSGTYVLRLTANDGVASVIDDVTVIANLPPTVNAGTNQTITLPTNSVNLSGTAADDGLPSGTLTTAWSKLSGPGLVSFGNTNALSTTATFSAGGSYVLQLTANDSAASATANVTVIVNTPPSVNAGPDQTIATSNLVVTLSGTVTDDNLPTGTLTKSWTKVGGPGTVTFGDASATNTTASFSVSGSYVLRLTASDGIAMASDDVVINTISGANDAALYVSKAALAINWASHGNGVNADTFKFGGSINPGKIKSDLSTASVTISVNGANIATGVTLTSSGAFASPPGSSPSFKFKLSPVNGKFSFTMSALDLQSILGLANATETGASLVNINVQINGAGLATPVTSAQLEFPYTSKQNSKTSAKFSFKSNRTFTGVFQSVKTAASQATSGNQAVTAQGPVVEGGSGPVVPNNDVTIHVGGATLVVPFASLVKGGTTDAASTWTYSSSAGPVAGLSRFSISNVARSFALGTADVAGTGIPAAGAAAPTNYDLPIEINVPTADGMVTFATTVELKRTSPTATKWKR